MALARRNRIQRLTLPIAGQRPRKCRRALENNHFDEFFWDRATDLSRTAETRNLGLVACIALIIMD